MDSITQCIDPLHQFIISRVFTDISLLLWRYLPVSYQRPALILIHTSQAPLLTSQHLSSPTLHILSAYSCWVIYYVTALTIVVQSTCACHFHPRDVVVYCVQCDILTHPLQYVCHVPYDEIPLSCEQITLYHPSLGYSHCGSN